MRVTAVVEAGPPPVARGRRSPCPRSACQRARAKPLELVLTTLSAQGRLSSTSTAGVPQSAFGIPPAGRPARHGTCSSDSISTCAAQRMRTSAPTHRVIRAPARSGAGSRRCLPDDERSDSLRLRRQKQRFVDVLRNVVGHHPLEEVLRVRTPHRDVRRGRRATPFTLAIACAALFRSRAMKKSPTPATTRPGPARPVHDPLGEVGRSCTPAPSPRRTLATWTSACGARPRDERCRARSSPSCRGSR